MACLQLNRMIAAGFLVSLEMEMGTMKKEKNREVKLPQNILQKFQLCLLGIQVILAVILGIKLISMGIAPAKYIFFYAAAIGLICVMTYFALKRKITTIIVIVLSVLITALLTYGMIAVIRLDHTIRDLSKDARLETVQMSVYVRSDDDASNLADLSGAKIGNLKDDHNVDDIMNEIVASTKKKPQNTDYDNIVVLMDALLNGDERAIVVNSAYIDILSEVDGYANIKDEIKELDTISVEVEMEDTEKNNVPYELSSDENTMIVYISGIDMWGAVNARSRSDVNILAVVNTKTGHIQLINTPRDYYIYLPEQKGYDKLTHAGLYGVDSSMSALENLYGIKIDYYIRLNFSGFESVIDTLGGVDVYSQYDFTVDPIKHYTVGYNHLTGLEALAFARERHAFANGDIQRGINQMEVIKAVISRMTSVDALEHYEQLLGDVEDCVMMDIPSNVIYDLVRYQLSSGVSWKIDNYTVTGTGESTYTYSMPDRTCYVMQPDEDKVDEAKKLIEDVLGEK